MKEKINGQIFKMKLGLRKEKKDPRDFDVEALGWGIYKPKHQEHYLEPLEIKNQSPTNTCTQVSLTSVNEKTQGREEILSEQCQTCNAMKNGTIHKDGFSTLSAQLKVLLEYGQCSKKLLNMDKANWARYSNIKNLTAEINADSKNNKIKSYWSCKTRNEKLKALDEGYPLYTGMNWYSSFCAYGGFANPFLIIGNDKTYKIGEMINPKSWATKLFESIKILFKGIYGAFVGGHAIYISGYNLNYHGRKVYRLTNSYGKSWGYEGHFYVDMDYFDAYGHSSYALMDIPLNIAQFLQDYNMGFVKSEDTTKKAIYMIISGEKRPFTDWVTFLSFGGGKGIAKPVKDELLNSVKTGEPMDIKESDCWELIKELAAPDNFKLVIEQARL